MTPETDSDQSANLITESRAQRITKALEKDPVFLKRLGPKNVEVSKRGGGVVLHYQATVDIIKAMKVDNVEVAEATKGQLLAYSCDYFKIPRPASLDEDEEASPEPVTEQPKPEPIPEPAVDTSPSSPEPVAEAPIPKPATPKPPKVKTAPKTASKAVEAKLESTPTVVKPDEPRLSEGTMEGPPELAIYVLLLSCLQLSKIDKKKGSEQRSKDLDRLARDYGRVIGAK